MSIPAYQLKITLSGTKPPIWRRIVVPGDWHLGQLHEAIQAAMGWEDMHLHEFERNRKRWGIPDPHSPYPDSTRDEESILLHGVLPAVGDRMSYLYDFGDSWHHVVVLEKRLPAETPLGCLAGRGVCPPEDCGGIWGYEDLRAALEDPQHPDHAQARELLGGEEFDLEAANTGVGVLGHSRS